MPIIEENMKKPVAEEPPEDAEALPQEGDDPEEEGVDASPEEQEMYDVLVVTALTYLFMPGATDMVVEKLERQSKEEGGIAFAIGHTVAMVLLAVKGAREKQGEPEIPGDIVVEAGREILAEVLNIAEKAGLIESIEDPELFKMAAFEAAKAYGDTELQVNPPTPEEKMEAQRAYADATAGKAPGAINGAMQEE